MKDKNRKIAIIGAGPSGLAAAYFLRQKGYSNITVFEKQNRVGGHCHTVVHNGKPYDLGAAFIPITHTEVRKLCKLLKINLIKHLQFANKEIIKKEIKNIENLYNFKHSKKELIKQFIKLIILQIKFSFSKKGNGYAQSNYHDLEKPLIQFLQEKKLPQLIPLFYLTVEPLGYGHLDQQPTFYALRSMKLGNCLSSLQVFLWGEKSLMIEKGWGEFCTQLANGFDIRLNSPVTKVSRSKLAASQIELYCNNDPVGQFDNLIWSCGLSEASRVLDVSTITRELFNKEKRNHFYTTLFSARGIPKSDFSIHLVRANPGPGGSTIMLRYWDEHDLYITWSYGDAGVTKERVVQAIEQEVKEMGGVLEEVKEQILWKLFPHVNGNDISAGYYNQIESLQGKGEIYYTGSSFTFETVEDVVRYSKQLVNHFF